MNDDYDKHIIQKYRLAVALAVIRDTPEDSNPKLYLEHLKSKIIPEMDPYDPDMTICEDDFDFNDDDNNKTINYNANNDIKLTDSQTNDSITILKDFDFNDMMRNMNNENNADTIENSSVSDVLRILKGVGNEELEKKEVPSANSDVNLNHIRLAYNDPSQNLSQNQQTNVPINGNIRHIHGNSELSLSEATPNSNKINDLKYQNPNIYVDNAAFCDSQTKGTQGNNSKLALTGDTTHDSNNKNNYLKPNINSADNAIFRDSQIDTYNEYTDNFTYVSQSQVDTIVLPRYLIEKDKSKDNKSKLLDYEIKQNINSIANNINANISADKDRTLTNIINVNDDSSNKIHGNTDVIIINDVILKDNKKHKFASQDYKIDINAKRSRNMDKKVHSDTDLGCYNEMKSKFDITSSTDSEMSLNNNLKLRPNDRFKNAMKTDIVNNSQEFSDTNDSDFNYLKYYTQNHNTNSRDNFGSQFSLKSSHPKKIAYGSQAFSHFSFEFDSEPSVDAVTSQLPKQMTSDDAVTSQLSKRTTSDDAGTSQLSKQTPSDYAVTSQLSKRTTIDDAGTSQIPEQTTIDDAVTSQLAQKTVAAKEDSEEEREELFDELTDSQAEVVPFKVLEELNKVKSFLNKRSRGGNSGYASDSGYRSDSQSRSSFRSALQSNLGLNQSAHCLLTYITTSPLAVTTEDITNEISRTLGLLIDRLHEQEKCPSFLEEHLQTVDRLLKEIYETESDDKVMEKEERIHRIFLLNKSSHIIKHTVEKIIIILEHILTILTEKEPLEVSRTIHIENLAHIFHILETLIKKLVIHKNLSQQSTQNSQEDEIVLKRSSLTDIWRRKWNPAKKSDLERSSSVKLCVLVRCSDVLNRLIVQAMDGYSLISYFALQCFNLLQN